MENFLSKIIDGKKVELIIDKNIFDKDIVLKSAYNFLDFGYFFFKLDNDGNIILQFTIRDNTKNTIENIISDFSEELISVYLRDKLEKENKYIRETIVGAAIANSLDSGNYTSFDTNASENYAENQIDFDKDIDDILREIENDPELKIDEEEIEKILREIDEETKNGDLNDSKNTLDKQDLKLNVDALNDIKSKFKTNI